MIQTSEWLSINGKDQFIAIRADRPGLPVLLYLHGGPGDAALPLVLKHNLALSEHFTLVIWEQRGAGKSYYRFGDDEEISLDLFVDDVHALVEALLRRFGQDKLYLVGHSWGTVLGLSYAEKHPEKLHAYVGCGQVVDMAQGSRLAYDFAVRKNREAGDRKALARLATIDPTYSSATWLDDLLFTTKQVVKHKGSAYGKRSYTSMVAEVAFSRHYSLGALVRRQKGSLQSIRRLWPELMGVDFRGITHFDMPVVFIEGRDDAHVSSELAASYFKTLTSEKDFHWFEKSAHFPQWSEPQRFARVLTSLL